MNDANSWSQGLVDRVILPRNSEELREWMRAHHIEETECITPDLAGVARGKAMPAQKFADLKASYCRFPSSFNPSLATMPNLIEAIF